MPQPTTALETFTFIKVTSGKTIKNLNEFFFGVYLVIEGVSFNLVPRGDCGSLS